MSSSSAAIALIVRDELRARGWSQARLGEHLGLAQTRVSARLTGRQPWKLTELDALEELGILSLHIGVSNDTLD